ncbi:MAG: hypothetical protein K2K06_07385 [Oscillospiraceae bacterium]|nr:hypothetical protein [Ruminococcus sp.]MDE6707842.1 hypothetical protein [Oscillospiraceae bacterium]
MQVILFCDKMTDCIPVKDCPEALLPVCNVSLLRYLLEYIQEKGFRNAVLLAVDERIRQLVDNMHLQIPVQFARSLAALHANTPTLLLRQLCLPDWDMGELLTLCNGGAVRLFHADSTPTFAELHPQGSVLLEPEQTEMTEYSKFQHIRTPAEYREMQQKLLTIRKFQRTRIGEGVKISRTAIIDELTIIGNDCIINRNVKLERCVLGDGVQIGAGAVLTDCVICRKAFIDEETHLENAVIPQGTVLQSNARTARTKQHCVLPEDGICEGLPRWNTAETALKAGASLTVIGNRLAIGYSHENAESLAIAAVAGAVSQGASVWLAGQCALSQLIAISKFTDCNALLWVQGERIMQIRPFRVGGFALTEQQSHRIWQALEANACERITEFGKLHHANNLLALWEDTCQKLLPEPEFEIHVSCANTQLRTVAQKLFSGGTGQRITLSLSEDGTKISAFSSESGMIRWEQLLLISLFSFQEQGEVLVLPEDFHPVAEDFASQYHAKITRLSDSNPSPAMLNLYQEQAVCTDGVTLFAHVLRVLKQKNQTLAQMAKILPEICTVQHELTTSLTRQSIEKLQRSNPDAKISIIMPPQSKLVRLRVHADSIETAAELCGFWEKKLRMSETESF